MGRLNFSDVVPLNVPTQAQFDSSTKDANTAFVQRALGSLAGSDTGFNALTATATIPATDIGKLINLGGASAQVVNLPTTAGLPDGASIVLYNQNATIGGATYTLTAQAGQSIVVSSAFASTLVLNSGDIVTLSVLSGNWAMSSGVSGVALSRLSSFASSVAVPGYQKLPSGLIVQWGSGQFAASGGNTQTITFPFVFPHANFMGVASMGSSYGAGGTATPAVPTFLVVSASQCQVQQTSSTAVAAFFYWIAIGW
jgi:hypothetical protein